jgi:F0F1-type ATP synthase membrane subunit a
MIELVRQLIRPITLGVRLAANLTAGHLILTLLASISFFRSIIAQFPLIILELVVSLVQPFVFCLLIFLYFIET